MRVSDAIWQRIAQEVDTVFFLPGGGCGPLVDALGQSGLRAVCTLHEQGAGFAAVAYAQHKGFAVALVTSGPGATNIMTPCLAAWVDSVPLLIISGQVMTRWLAMPGMRSRGTQEGPTIEMVKPITKMAVLVDNPSDVDNFLEDAIATAKSGRAGPVWLDITMDTQNADVV
jgi:acetolactate synthase-1/2/3 large subunit